MVRIVSLQKKTEERGKSRGLSLLPVLVKKCAEFVPGGVIHTTDTNLGEEYCDFRSLFWTAVGEAKRFL